jgi:Phage integrase central domain
VLRVEKNAQAATARAAHADRRTFSDAARDYLAKFEREWKNSRHALQWHASLREYVLPMIGKLDVQAIGTADVLRVLEPIWTKIPETASRVRGRIETVLDFAGRSEANPARWKGHLEFKLTKRNEARTVKHLAALPYDEIGSFMGELRATTSIGGPALPSVASLSAPLDPAQAGIPNRRSSMRTTSAGARPQNSAQSAMSTRRFASSASRM